MTSSIRGGGVLPVPAVAGDGDRGGEMPEEGLDDGAGDGPRRGRGVPGGEFTGADTVGDDADDQGVVHGGEFRGGEPLEYRGEQVIMAAELPFHGTRRHAGELGDIARCCGDESAVGDEGGRRVEDVGTGITVRVVGRETAGRVVVKGAGSLGEWPWASELPTVVLPTVVEWVSEAVIMVEPSVVGCVVSGDSPSGRRLRTVL